MQVCCLLRVKIKIMMVTEALHGNIVLLANNMYNIWPTVVPFTTGIQFPIPYQSSTKRIHIQYRVALFHAICWERRKRKHWDQILLMSLCQLLHWINWHLACNIVYIQHFACSACFATTPVPPLATAGYMKQNHNWNKQSRVWGIL